MQHPEHLRYTSDHEWVSVDGATARMGITDYAQGALGDVVYVDLPEVGSVVKLGASFSEVESTKSVSDIYAPLSGMVTAVNESLANNPDALNGDPYGAGWICEIGISDPSELDGLLSVAAYQALIEG